MTRLFELSESVTQFLYLVSECRFSENTENRRKIAAFSVLLSFIHSIIQSSSPVALVTGRGRPGADPSGQQEKV